MRRVPFFLGKLMLSAIERVCVRARPIQWALVKLAAVIEGYGDMQWFGLCFDSSITPCLSIFPPDI